MVKNIYVGNLDFTVIEDDLRELFRAYGLVETVTLAMDRDTGHSRGFAFVEMQNDMEAAHAIAALNGTVFRGRTLNINESRPKHESLDGKAPVERRRYTREALKIRGHRKHQY